MLTSSFRFPYFPLPFRFLSSASFSLPATGPSVSSFPFFPFLPHSGILGAVSPLSLPDLPRSLLPGFPCIPSRFPYSAFCWFLFVLPCFAPAAVPQVIPFQITPPGPMLDFRFLSSASVLAPHYSASVSSFPFSSCFCLTVASSGDPSAFASSVFPVLSSLISHAFLPGSGTQLSVCFLSSFPVSLPQLFHRCLPSAFAFGLSPSFPLSFVCFFSGSDYSAFCSSVPFFLASPLSGFSSAPVLPFGFPAFHLLFRLVSHASFPVSGTWLSVCFLSSFPVSLPQPFHRCFPSFPLSFVRFSSGLSACFPLSFVRFCLRLTTQPSALSFPFFPFSPGSGSFGAYFPLPSGLFPCLPSDSGTQLPAFPFDLFLFRLTVATFSRHPLDFSSG